MTRTEYRVRCLTDHGSGRMRVIARCHRSGCAVKHAMAHLREHPECTLSIYSAGRMVVGNLSMLTTGGELVAAFELVTE